mmetsp:Transcript_80686/g.216254  ORF Transcript_80686/g.216254 Transcript_80686/m.216254 type:complete len:227 (-) Transcript_80686:867-1547(-)
MPKSYGKAVPFNTHAERFEPQKPASSTDEIVEASTPDYDAINRITGAFSKVWTSRPLPSSVFRSRTGRVFDESHQPLPDPSLQRLKPHPSLGPSLGIQVDIVPHSPQRDRRDEPGPGHYQGTAGSVPSLDGLRPSCMFARSGVDRFGQPLAPRAAPNDTPGPGSYNPVPKGAAGPAAACVFASASARTSEVEPSAAVRLAVPGPAYYNPALPGRKTFNLNAARRWV